MHCAISYEKPYCCKCLKTLFPSFIILHLLLTFAEVIEIKSNLSLNYYYGNNSLAALTGSQMILKNSYRYRLYSTSIISLGKGPLRF